jgi:hypothetical protein
MEIIFDGKTYECEKMQIIENHLFLDNTDVGRCEDPKFRAATIDGKVYMTQWQTINGGANV